MASYNLNLGHKGEDLACEYLKSQGMTILCRNWYCGKKEIDIIARDGEEVVFVEVKTRKTMPIKPCDVISYSKMTFLLAAAESFVRRYNFCGDSRFDVIIVAINDGVNHIEHIPYAFHG